MKVEMTTTNITPDQLVWLTSTPHEATICSVCYAILTEPER